MSGLCLLLSACTPPTENFSQDLPQKPQDSIVLYESKDGTHNPERGLGTLADPTSTESMANPGNDRTEELLPNRLYSDFNSPYDGAVVARF